MTQKQKTKKALICAGGLGTRLYDLTSAVNKHTLPVYDKPMIMHVIATLVKGGISEVMLLMNGKSPGIFLEMLHTGEDLGCNISYRFEKNVGGPGRSLLLGESFIGDDEDFVLILGDSLILEPLSFEKKAPHLYALPIQDKDGTWHDNPQKYGQIRVDESRGRVTGMVEKPKEVFSNIVHTACFVLPKDAFDRLRAMNKVANKAEEVGIFQLAQEYINEGSMGYTMLPPRSYIDCGTPDALLEGGRRVAEIVKGLKK